MELQAVGGLGAQGRVLLDGGRLSVGGLSVQPGGRLDWRSGDLYVGGTGLSVGPTGGAGAALVVPDGSGLTLLNSLSLQAAGVVVLQGRGTLSAASLNMQGGTLVGDVGLGQVVSVVGTGQVIGRVAVGDASTRITASGALAVGALNRADAVSLGGGTVRVMANSVLQLNSADLAVLPVSNRLDNGALLSAANGMLLRAGRALTVDAAASARVQGRFVNQGSVTVGAGGLLRFEDDVSGAGSFSGAVVFDQGLNGGLASLDFGGGDVSFERGATLSLGIAADGRAGRLAGLGQLALGGLLLLNFDGDFSAGGTVDLLDFAQWSGGFGADQVSVSGLDASRLDFSLFTVDGRVGISPVPEPGAAWLWLAALPLLLRRLRQPRRD